MSTRKLPAADQQPMRLSVVQRPIAELKADARNPRQHGKKQIRQIAKSIQTLGFNVPVLVDEGGQVIAGHARLLACRELGWTEVPTLCLDHLNPEQARAYAIANNRLAETADWNGQLTTSIEINRTSIGIVGIEATCFSLGPSSQSLFIAAFG